MWRTKNVGKYQIKHLAEFADSLKQYLHTMKGLIDLKGLLKLVFKDDNLNANLNSHRQLTLTNSPEKKQRFRW